MNLSELGFTPALSFEFEQQFGNKENLLPARVVRADKDRYTVLSEAGQSVAEVTGKMLHDARARGDLPVVGDRVAV